MDTPRAADGLRAAAAAKPGLTVLATYADSYPADLIIHDIRSFSLQPEVLAADMPTWPTWSTLPAVEAGQIAGWSAETVLSYQGFTVAMNDLAAAIARSSATVV